MKLSCSSSFLIAAIIFCSSNFSLNFALAENSADKQDLPSDLTTVGLETLLNFDLKVTLPSRRSEQLSTAASAVFVITQDDIRKSGVTHVAEALRLAPGVNVARVSSNRWAISIRGFNQVFANKLLVLVDGVSVFSPTTNGVYWEANELLLEDIERIEVVRGPGAAIWGANAVNGVINIISKKSSDTQGWLAKVGAGTHERALTSLRYGGRTEDGANFRLYGIYNNRDEQRLKSGGSAEDDWQSGAAGFRMDNATSSSDQVTFSADLQKQWDTLWPTVPALTPPYVDASTFKDSTTWQGLRTALNWEHSFSETSSLGTLLSYQRKERESSLVSFSYDILSLDIRHQFQLAEQHSLVYGTHLRYFSNTTEGSYAQQANPDERSTGLFSAFLHDDYTIIDDKLRLIVGAKAEHNDSTGLEFAPNARIVYTPTNKLTFWSAVSKAFAPPALFFEDSAIPVAAIPLDGSPLPGLLVLTGSRSLASENILAYEAGTRFALSSNFSIDLTAFYNRYDDVFSAEPAAATFNPNAMGLGMPAIEIPLNFDNQLEADSYGAEVISEWRATNWLKLTTWYSFLRIDVDANNSLDTGNADLIENGSPQHQAGFRSQLNLSKLVDLNATLRYVDRLKFGSVDAYVELDLGLNWQIDDNLEFAVYGQNLLHNDHQEYTSSLFGLPPTDIKRAAFGQFRWKF